MNKDHLISNKYYINEESERKLNWVTNCWEAGQGDNAILTYV